MRVRAPASDDHRRPVLVVNRFGRRRRSRRRRIRERRSYARILNWFIINLLFIQCRRQKSPLDDNFYFYALSSTTGHGYIRAHTRAPRFDKITRVVYAVFNAFCKHFPSLSLPSKTFTFFPFRDGAREKEREREIFFNRNDR